VALLRGVALTYHEGTSYNIAAMPAGTVIGDLIIIAIGDRFSPSMPAGWTTVTTGSGTNQFGRLAWRICDASDAAAGTLTYILSGVGSGHAGVFVYQGGTFNTASPIDYFQYALSATVPVEMPYLAVNTGQTLFHFANMRSVAPTQAFSSRGVVLAHNEAAEAAAAAYGDESASETTSNTVWDTAATITGSFLIEFSVASASGTAVMPGMTATVYPITATFGAVPVSPDPGLMQLTQTPTLIALVSGTPSPFQVQYQTSADTTFTTVSWTQTLTGQIPGFSTITVGVNLTDGATHYWRVRAGDGTVWGPWSDPSALRIYLARASAREYFYLNYGAQDGTVVAHGVEEFYLNAGISATSVAHAVEYFYENVGFVRTGADAAVEYFYEGDVSENIPTPHVWFTWLEYGFATDHVFVYGQGFGTLPEDYGAEVMIDWGPNFTLGDVSTAIFDWSVQPAITPDAYNADRRIAKGSDTVPPFTNVETDIVEIVIPSGIVPAVADGPQNDLVYVRHSGLESNRVIWLMYPTVPTPLGNVPGTVGSAASMRIIVDPVEGFMIPQLRARYELAGLYHVVGGMPQQPPQHLANSLTSARLSSWDVTSSLEVATSVDMGATLRWLPDPDQLVAHSELGTGVSVWEPSVGTGFGWRFDVDTAPFVDPAYVAESRLGPRTTGALVMPGDAWMDMTEAFPDGPAFTLAMVAVLHAGSDASSPLFASFVDGAVESGTQSLLLDLTGAQLALTIGGQLSRDGLTQLSGRPVIIVLACARTESRITLVDSTPAAKNIVHPPLQASGLKLYLGRNDDVGPDQRIARLDILDLSYWDSALSQTAMNDAANRLDSIYGVTE
jgi:hypothetical protein